AWQQRLRDAIADANEIGAALELALHLSSEKTAALEAVRHELAGAEVARYILYDDGLPATSADTVELARKILRGLVGGGSDANFAELNRNRAVAAAADFVAFSLNPQVHGTDELTIVENLGGQAAAVR